MDSPQHPLSAFSAPSWRFSSLLALLGTSLIEFSQVLPAHACGPPGGRRTTCQDKPVLRQTAPRPLRVEAGRDLEGVTRDSSILFRRLSICTCQSSLIRLRAHVSRLHKAPRPVDNLRNPQTDVEHCLFERQHQCQSLIDIKEEPASRQNAIHCLTRS